MSSILFSFIQKTSGLSGHLIQANFGALAMSKRNGFSRTPKFKPEVKVMKNRTKFSLSMTRKEKVEVLSTPIKSQADKKLYKTIRLENGLTALLISDPTSPKKDDNSSSEEESGTSDESTEPESDSGKSGHSSNSDRHSTQRRQDFDEEKLAACALCVGVGSYSDPKDIQGLAHFVEHMVFMGSDKYPKENEFDAFIKKKGGSDNASTDVEVTTFYFEIQEKHLAQAMDMFSQFFVSPIMQKEAMQREREAIESEFALAQPSDSNRKDQLLATFFPEDHPARSFTWGNLRSLKEEQESDEKLYRAAHEFRRRHYSAHRMTLAVQARMDLPSLEKYVVNTFGQIPTNNLPPTDYTKFNFNGDNVTDAFKSIYYVKPISDTTELHLTWCLRSLVSEYESKPHQYLSNLLGHEGKGSLLSYLRKKVWALGIYCGNSESGIDYTSIYSLFSTQVILTKEGLDHVDEVLEAIFSYLNMIRQLGPSERIFNEIKTIEETSFRFDEEAEPAEYVENMAENMQFYPPEHYITGSRLYYKYKPKVISEILSHMRADTVNIMIMSKRYSDNIIYDQKEKWFGTEYKKKEIPKSLMTRWLNVAPYKDFHLPEENQFLATNFDILPPDPVYIEEAEKLGVDLYNTTAKDLNRKVQAAEKETKVFRHEDLMATVKNFRLDEPSLLRKSRHVELWYKPDFKFRLPTALLYFYFITPLTFKSPTQSCLLDLWSDVLQQGLKEEVYPASMADLSHSLSVADMGFTLKVYGYNQNLHLLVDLITRELRSASSRVTPEMFEAIRDVRSRTYHNVLIKPHKLAKDLRMQILLEPYITPRDKAMVIHNVTLDELKEFSENMLKKMYLQVLVHGNLAWHEAITITDKVLANTKFDPLPEKEKPRLKVHQLPLGEHKIRVSSFNTASTNSFVTNYYQGEAHTPQDNAVLEILMMLMEEPVFDALRTKEQLGYSVFSMMRYTFGVLGFTVTVNTQADKHSVAYVDRRITAFMQKFGREMKRLNDKTLHTTKAALVQLKHTTAFELKEEAERYWREITSLEYRFHRHFEEADAINRVKVADVKRWIESHGGAGRGQYRKLSVQIQGYLPNDTANIDNTTVTSDYTLKYIETKDKDDVPDTEAAFIKDIDQFKKDLPLIDVPKVELV